MSLKIFRDKVLFSYKPAITARSYGAPLVREMSMMKGSLGQQTLNSSL